jgi:mRNA-degrading endonuclease toxin of MazEF toxin-antitoxin module
VIKVPYADMAPYLPGVGEVYRVDPSIVHPADRAPDRPVLVVEVPATVHGRITVVTRTSDQGRVGVVASPEDPDLGFDGPGVWASLRTAEAGLWTASMVQFRGTVDLAVLTAVRKAFGL